MIDVNMDEAMLDRRRWSGLNLIAGEPISRACR
jgi:hypothetical protein